MKIKYHTLTKPRLLKSTWYYRTSITDKSKLHVISTPEGTVTIPPYKPRKSGKFVLIPMRDLHLPAELKMFNMSGSGGHFFHE